MLFRSDHDLNAFFKVVRAKLTFFLAVSGKEDTVDRANGLFRRHTAERFCDREQKLVFFERYFHIFTFLVLFFAPRKGPKEVQGTSPLTLYVLYLFFEISISTVREIHISVFALLKDKNRKILAVEVLECVERLERREKQEAALEIADF